MIAPIPMIAVIAVTLKCNLLRFEIATYNVITSFTQNTVSEFLSPTFATTIQLYLTEMCTPVAVSASSALVAVISVQQQIAICWGQERGR